MRQTLAILLVLALIGTALANIRSDITERRRKESAKNYASMQRVKSLDPGTLRNRMDFRMAQEEAQRAQKAGIETLREKYNTFKAPKADELEKIRNRMAAGGAKMAAGSMNLRNGRDMKSKMRKSFKRQP